MTSTTRYYSLDGEVWEKSSQDSYLFSDITSIEYGNAIEMIKKLEETTLEQYTVYVKVEDIYDNFSEIQKVIIRKDLMYDNTLENNLRFVGANPNNYVSFNNELWRVIGVMEQVDNGTGKKESRLKLIRNDSIGSYSWNSSPSTVNSGNGVNEWSVSDVKVLLNQFYYDRLSNQTCYNGHFNLSTLCSFSEIGFKEESKKYIENAIWFTGTNGKNDYTSSSNGTPSHFYSYERSNNSRKICVGGGNCDDSAPITTRWTGNIGLMYPSDYGYATSGGETLNRTKCLNTAMYSWANTDCSTDNWLTDGNYRALITPYAHSSHSDDIFYLGVSGEIRAGFASTLSHIYPSIYLKSNVQIVAGLGTEQNPYVLTI